MGTKLERANLQGANLQGANLEEANLQEANLEEANFEGAHLTGTLNLSIDQLSKVRALYNVKLDEEFLIQLKEGVRSFCNLPAWNRRVKEIFTEKKRELGS